ncbi:MAG: prepilin-type N-terminal cleavage/methylation domain-containing protein [Deltaproteobacteria bacterium]|nr:prepilin-type N-terminal cleavage/methylation domain-containing protein [Deltaproteobacteria bacterium]
MMNLRNKEVGNLTPKYSVFCQSSIINHQSSIPPGFTLLELLISLTIIGLILVLVFGALRIGARAWEKGEKDVEIHQRQRVVLDNIKRQIASTCLREIKDEAKKGAGKKRIFFRGDSEGMEFMSYLPMVPTTRSGMVYVKYVVDEEDGGKKMRLMLFEKDIVFIEKEEDIGDPDEADFFELIPGAENIEFAYMKGPEDKDADPEWQDAWDPDSDTGIPLAIKITLQEDEDTAPIYVIARLQAEVDQ